MQHAADNRRWGWGGQIVAAALLFVLVLRALIPAGFMLAPSASHPGRLTLTICSSNAGRLIAAPVRVEPHRGHDHGHHRDHQPAPQHDHDSPAGIEHQLCGFAVAAAGDVPPVDGLALASVPAAAVALAVVMRDLVVTPAPVGSPLGSRAPPVAV